ncbi:L-threonylcarbamoyladenylate synthase [Leptothoe kymatousa]|uniref:L-threonylcarbamoyladenylate synthase n=1 Tax=Leptothoe kymatousa TAU-MAC 1615 TaxID=2364775 RepID=A0ABS5XZ26_9CYAN|nr:Sua5/YciO/YrdC/YwlC family protein [Leptothoe kymatousa]MBT9310862.1 Sua5/YciO/YrdC/YwlC family protein [Leptothoe kymatousa TAU-MAC 1615]
MLSLLEKIARVTGSAPTPLVQAAKIIQQGGLVIVPTHSIYVLACSAFSVQATARLRRAKQSPATKPLTIVVDKDAIASYAHVDQRQSQIIDCIVPHMPVSMWLKKKTHGLDAAIAHSDAVVMYFQETEIGQLYKQCGCPLAISSANMAGGTPVDTVNDAKALFGNDVDYYVGGGDQRSGEPTAHIDIRETPIRLKRAATANPFSVVQAVLSAHHLD